SLNHLIPIKIREGMDKMQGVLLNRTANKQFILYPNKFRDDVANINSRCLVDHQSERTALVMFTQQDNASLKIRIRKKGLGYKYFSFFRVMFIPVFEKIKLHTIASL